MPHWKRLLARILFVVAAMPGGAGAWQWALTRAIPSPSPTTQLPILGFGSSLAAFGSSLLVGNPAATGGPLAVGAGYLMNPATGAVLQTFYSPDASTCFFGSTVAAVGGGAAWVG